MRERLLAIVDELRRLRSNGVRHVSVGEKSIERLRDAIRGAGPAPKVIAETDTGPDPAPEPAGESPVAERDPPRSPIPGGRGAARPSDDVPPIPASPATVALPAGDKQTRWNALLDAVRKDVVCGGQVRPGKKIVLGVGNLDAAIFFCGEAPGADEEIQGEPFVGPAGKLLTRMIQAMGLQRQDVYIGNILNWRPRLPVSGNGEQYGNRPPTSEEINYCLPYLRAQLDIVQPRLIVALGATAAAGLLGAGSFATLGEVRGRWHTFDKWPVMVTYHPSYILRNQSNRSKRANWEDLLKVMERAGLPISEKQRSFFL